MTKKEDIQEIAWQLLTHFDRGKKNILSILTDRKR